MQFSTKFAPSAPRPQLRVRGVEGLRVIDASVMPVQMTGNIHPTVLMIGERGADLVKQDADRAGRDSITVVPDEGTKVPA